MSELISKRLDLRHNLLITFLVALLGLVAHVFINHKSMLDYEFVLWGAGFAIDLGIILFLLKDIKKLEKELESELKGGAK